jgi:hypothetical protein
MPKPGWVGKQYVVNHVEDVPSACFSECQTRPWAKTQAT